MHQLQTKRGDPGTSIESATDPEREQRAQAAPDIYTLGSNAAERDRLRRQSIELGGLARELLERIGLRAGQRAIDIGCGPSGVLELLSDRVGSDGEVMGLDRDPAHVALARTLAARDLTNVQIIEGDARRTGLPPSSFDLVHARLLLVNIPRPEEVLSEMVRIARPGGWVASQEADVLFLCDPPHPAWQRLIEAWLATYRADGADPFIGRRLRELYRQAGLVDVQVAVRADHHTAGDSRHTVLPDLVRSMREKIIARELLTEQELDELDHAARAHLSKTSALTVPHLLFTVWGRKPD